jgi:hypothetical protein
VRVAQQSSILHVYVVSSFFFFFFFSLVQLKEALSTSFRVVLFLVPQHPLNQHLHFSFREPPHIQQQRYFASVMKGLRILWAACAVFFFLTQMASSDGSVFVEQYRNCTSDLGICQPELTLHNVSVTWHPDTYLLLLTASARSYLPHVPGPICSSKIFPQFPETRTCAHTFTRSATAVVQAWNREYLARTEINTLETFTKTYNLYWNEPATDDPTLSDPRGFVWDFYMPTEYRKSTMSHYYHSIFVSIIWRNDEEIHGRD